MKKIILAIFLVLTALIAISVAIPIVCAQDEAPPEVSWDWIHGVWAVAKATPIALVIAFATTLVGYLSKTDPEKFRLDYFIFTALISFVVGIATIVIKLPYDQWYSWLANGFMTWYIWKVARIIAKKLNWIVLTSPAPTGPGPPTTA